MAVNPNTTNLAVQKDIADRLRQLAKDNDTTTLDITNQLLKFALDQGEVDIEVRSVKIKPKAAPKKPPGKK
jgi:hypothetical protein